MKKLLATEILIATKEFFYPMIESKDDVYIKFAKKTIDDIDKAILELELLQNDLKDLFSCIELTEDENAEKRLSSMETYLIRLSRALK